MTKRSVTLGAIVLTLTLFSVACSGPDGNVYQKYWWSGSLYYFYDTNPSTPNTIYNDVYFSSEPGRFYMEYTAWNDSSWWMYYTISTQPGGMFFSQGPDTWFEILLLSSGPSLYRWESEEFAYSIHGSEHTVDPSVTHTDQRISDGRTRGDVEGTSTRQFDFGYVTIEYGRILD